LLLKFSDWLVYAVLGLSPDSRFGGALNFFIYDSLKIITLLFTLIIVIGFIRTYIPRRRINQWMSKKGVAGNFFASLFGAVTPFCSCSSIPLFLGFLEAGVPLGVTLSFLLTSPIINEYLVVLMLGFFGWKITLLYVLSGLFIGTVTGIILGKLKLEKYLVPDILGKRNADCPEEAYLDLMSRVKFGLNESVCILRKIWIWVLFGVGIGAAIHNYVPQEAIQAVIGKAGVFSVPVAVILGVPLYGSCAAIVPIAVALFQKGIPLGTALAFMMAIAALSLPEAILLRRAMRIQLIALFFAIASVAIIVTGYLFNFLQSVLT